MGGRKHQDAEGVDSRTEPCSPCLASRAHWYSRLPGEIADKGAVDVPLDGILTPVEAKDVPVVGEIAVSVVLHRRGRLATRPTGTVRVHIASDFAHVRLA